MAKRWLFRWNFLHFFAILCVCCTAVVIVLVIALHALQTNFDVPEPDLDLGEAYERSLREQTRRKEEEERDRLEKANNAKNMKKNIKDPLILWWTPFTGEAGKSKKCGDVSCFFTQNRRYQTHKKTKAFMFYGTDMRSHDLPLPREPHHEWGLLHEESPKNTYLFSHEPVMKLFNHTATFKRESDIPLTTFSLQSLKFLESKELFVSTQDKNRYKREMNLAPIVYVQSDCQTASDRDTLVEMLMKYIPIDSYGKCLHNKDLGESRLRDPIQGMEDHEFYQLMAKYKFTITFENAICNDYITEKLWRPLHLGSVPILFGSPKVQDYLPDNKSAILISDFKTVEDLASYIQYLDKHDDEYDKYLNFKRSGVTNQNLRKIMQNRVWGVNDWRKPNMVDVLECLVCKRIHENKKREADGLRPVEHIATLDHYGCPAPLRFTHDGKLTRTDKSGMWWNIFQDSVNEAEMMVKCIAAGILCTERQFSEYILQKNAGFH